MFVNAMGKVEIISSNKQTFAVRFNITLPCCSLDAETFIKTILSQLKAGCSEYALNKTIHKTTRSPFVGIYKLATEHSSFATSTCATAHLPCI